MFYFYLLRTPDNTLYTGITSDLNDRESRHNTGRGSNWTTIHGGGVIVYTESFATRAEMKKENLIKGLKP